MAVPHRRNLWMRAGKIRGQDCSARAEKRQGGILTEVGL